MKWKQLPFDDVIVDCTAGNRKLLTSEYRASGRFAIIDQGQAEVAGWCDDEEAVCKVQLPCLIFGDHTKIFKYIESPFVLGADGVKVLQHGPGWDTRFLFYALRRTQFPERESYERHYKYLRRTSIPLPPLPEQRRIAELLDRADALRRKRKEALQLTEDLLRSVFLEMFGDPVTNPKGWEVRALGEHFAAAPQNGTVEPATPDGLYPVVRVGELGSDLVDIAECGQVNLPQGDVVKYRCQAGDFLLARAIGSESHLGKASMVPSSSVPIVYDSHVMRLRFNKDKIIPLFFLIWLRIPGGRQLFMAKARRTAVQWNINAEQIAAIQMPTPPIQMQRKFVTQCDLIQRELAQHARSSQDLDSLFSSLLHQAFSGAL